MTPVSHDEYRDFIRANGAEAKVVDGYVTRTVETRNANGELIASAIYQTRISVKDLAALAKRGDEPMLVMYWIDNEIRRDQ